jgi:hypothetical protein
VQKDPKAACFGKDWVFPYHGVFFLQYPPKGKTGKKGVCDDNVTKG